MTSLTVFNAERHVAHCLFQTKEAMDAFLVQLRSGEWGLVEKISKSGPPSRGAPPWEPMQDLDLGDDFRPFVKKRLSKRKVRPVEIRREDGSIQSTILPNTFVYSVDHA